MSHIIASLLSSWRDRINQPDYSTEAQKTKTGQRPRPLPREAAGDGETG